MVGDAITMLKKTSQFTGIKIRLYIKQNYFQHATNFL
jgi:hypothetical protein